MSNILWKTNGNFEKFIENFPKQKISERFLIFALLKNPQKSTKSFQPLINNQLTHFDI